MSRLGSHRTVTYDPPNRNGCASIGGSLNRRNPSEGPMWEKKTAKTGEREAERSRSRSYARADSENLLVSLDESVLPPQIAEELPQSSELAGLSIVGTAASKKLSLDEGAA